MNDLRLILSCEHGGCRVPVRYAACFRQAEAALHSHRGYDAGSLELARRLAARTQAPLFAAHITRLLVDLNRSPGHPALFSEFTEPLSADEKRAVLAQHYYPHRRRVEAAMAASIQQGHTVLHIGIHTFTPVFRDRPRRADVGLLYDPARSGESAFCRRWQQQLRQRMPGLIVRRNYPYLGKTDGLTTALRRRFAPQDYLGVELEINQRWTERSPANRRQLANALIDSLNETTSTAKAFSGHYTPG
jgi:predicted N-formylglutamate amidohydrolase